MQQLIDFSKKHTTVIGITGSGKTWGAAKSIAKQQHAVLFFNTLRLGSDKLPKEFNRNFVTATVANTWQDIYTALRAGKKINMLPPVEHDKKEKLLAYLIKKLFEAEGFTEDKPVYICVDEVHLFTKDSQKACEMVATSGRSQGIIGIWISQRPALISNTLMTQSDKFVIFNVHMEGQYLKRYNIPYEDLIKPKLEKGGEYSYCVYDFKSVLGAYKV